MKTHHAKQNTTGRDAVSIQFTMVTLISILVFATGGLSAAPSAFGTPKTSQHASFKPEKFERLAVIVKPIQATQGGMGGFGGMSRGGQQHQQSQLERLVEQGFMRVLLGDGYTLVSRADLDAAMKEKGLDEAKLTDEKLTQEAAKLLHVSALVVVSVDALKTSNVQRQGQGQINRSPGLNSGFGNNNNQQYFELVASVSARLIKIDDNMVMWTGDLTVSRTFASQIQDSAVLASMAEAIASAFPPLTPKKK